MKTLKLAIDLGPIETFKSGLSKPVSSSTAPSRLANIITIVITTMTIFAGLAFLFYFIIGAFNWITSGGKPEQLNKAKSQMSSAFVGLLVAILIIPIAYIISRLTGLSILNPEIIINRLKPPLL